MKTVGRAEKEVGGMTDVLVQQRKAETKHHQKEAEKTTENFNKDIDELQKIIPIPDDYKH